MEMENPPHLAGENLEAVDLFHP
ncbi:uncharacterized protein G2W53_035766 [Senna tora]|uniref:Uncharacterized protein n=1 Tax=Senna tora TaxID=362788 RepID=A0A834STB0_9FABA|nr:uncharacterized protein G2W53_035766 [Senna tora]